MAAGAGENQPAFIPVFTLAGENIRVAIRVRNVISREEAAKLEWRVDGSNVISALDGSKKYQFDRVFNPNEGNSKVYEDIGFDVIESALNGFNSTIFAYGQTASGKTHTMLGSKEDPGIMRHAVDHIFDAIEQTPVREEQNDEKSDDEEMPELVTDSDDNDNAENEASNPVLELEIAEMKDQIDEEIKKIQALTAKEFIFTENTPFVPSNPMEIPPGLAYLQKYADPYVQDHANEESIDNSSGPPTSNFDFPTELVMLDDYNTVRRGDVVYANLSNQTADGW